MVMTRKFTTKFQNEISAKNAKLTTKFLRRMFQQPIFSVINCNVVVLQNAPSKVLIVKLLVTYLISHLSVTHIGRTRLGKYQI